MTLDNASLQRRLIQVSGDLNRLRNEEEGYFKQLQFLEAENRRMEQVTNMKDETDMDNQTMQEELANTRMENKHLESCLHDQKGDTAKAGNAVDRTAADAKGFAGEAENMNNDLMHKIDRIDNIRTDHGDVLQNINGINQNLDQLNVDELETNHQNIDLSTDVQRIQADRAELNAKMEEMTKLYDETVREKTHDKNVLQEKKRWQAKVITSKIFL